MARLQTDLSEFIGLLNSHGVEYLIVGGHAVAYHGHPRFTGDIDFLLRPTRDNADRLLQVLRAFGFGDIDVSAGDFTTPDRTVQLGRPPNRIDILTSISAVSFDDAWNGRVAGRLGGHAVNFLGWEALIRNKTASARDKDQLDVRTLLAIAARKNDGREG